MRLPDANTLQVLLDAVGIKLSLWETQRVLDQIQSETGTTTELDLLVQDMRQADQRLVQVLEKITMDADPMNRVAASEEQFEEGKNYPPTNVIRCRDWFSNPPSYTYSEVS
jgi:hypothetical protein